MAVNSRLRFERKAGGKVIAGRDVEGLKQVKFAGKNGVGRGTVFCGEVKIGVASTLGSNCHVNGPVSIGNYCQLGQAVGIYGRDHPLTHITTYVNRNLLDGVMSTFSDVKKVRIGHDVYVGHGAIILKGVTIGNGAVIGAGSVVTNSIPDYAIAYGTPARVAGSRLPENIVRLLQKIEWWNWDEKKVKDHRELFLLDLADPEQLVRFESLLKKFGLI